MITLFRNSKNHKMLTHLQTSTLTMHRNCICFSKIKHNPQKTAFHKYKTLHKPNYNARKVFMNQFVNDFLFNFVLML